MNHRNSRQVLDCGDEAKRSCHFRFGGSIDLGSRLSTAKAKAVNRSALHRSPKRGGGSATARD